MKSSPGTSKMVGRKMASSSVLAFALLQLPLLLQPGQAQAEERDVFLPADCDAITIHGEGFKLKFEQIKQNWVQVAEESARVEVPSHQEGHQSSAANGATAPAAATDGDVEKPLVNENLYDKTEGEVGAKDYGSLPDELFKWISDRAGQLVARVERYNDELAASQGAQRIVIDVLLLNTLVDLDNLSKEKIKKLVWLDRKLKNLFGTQVNRQIHATEVGKYVADLIRNNQDIESKVRGRNDPGRVWVTNTQALRRILHEQRYSQELADTIVQFLAGPFNLMKRSIVYQQNRGPKELDDGLYYKFAVGRVPNSFPFASQDAITHDED